MKLAHMRRTRLAAVPMAVVLSTVGLAACGEEDTAGPETGAAVEDIQEDEAEEAAADEDAPVDPPTDDGEDVMVFGDDFDDAQSFVGQEVTVSADINEMIPPNAFTIAGTENTDLEPLLVVGAGNLPVLEEDMAVQVTGTVRQSFVLAEAEEELGVDLEDELFAEFEQEPYIVAANVSTDVPEEPENGEES